MIVYMCFVCYYIYDIQGSIAKKPYNPIIGETFHCSWKIPPKTLGSDGDQGEHCLMTYTAEQVSHHPPGKSTLFYQNQLYQNFQ